MLESVYQARLVKKIEDSLRGSFVLKNDPGYRQGVPDLTILYFDRWGMLEVKTSFDADYQPNQEYYLNLFGNMSFAAMICPENEEEVLNALQVALVS